MYCKMCGNKIDDNSEYCHSCGTKIEKGNAELNNETGEFKFLLAIIGFFSPIAGLIFFLLYENKKPKRAKAAAKGAISGLITKVVLVILIYALCIGGAIFAGHNISDKINSDIDSYNEEQYYDDYEDEDYDGDNYEDYDNATH